MEKWITVSRESLHEFVKENNLVRVGYGMNESLFAEENLETILLVKSLIPIF